MRFLRNKRLHEFYQLLPPPLRSIEYALYREVDVVPRVLPKVILQVSVFYVIIASLGMVLSVCLAIPVLRGGRSSKVFTICGLALLVVIVFINTYTIDSLAVHLSRGLMCIVRVGLIGVLVGICLSPLLSKRRSRRE